MTRTASTHEIVDLCVVKIIQTHAVQHLTNYPFSSRRRCASCAIAIYAVHEDHFLGECVRSRYHVV